MKHLKAYERKHKKTYENKWFGYPDYKVGDKVVVIDSYVSTPEHPCIIKDDETCTIIKVDEIYCFIMNKDGVIEEYHKKRIIPELEYDANKFNL